MRKVVLSNRKVDYDGSPGACAPGSAQDRAWTIAAVVLTRQPLPLHCRVAVAEVSYLPQRV